jgi:hypothetical protein
MRFAAFGGSGFRFARSFASLIPTQTSTHILPALVFATQSPYPGWQNVVNSRKVMRNFLHPILSNFESRAYFKGRNKKPERVQARRHPCRRFVVDNIEIYLYNGKINCHGGIL